MRKVYLLLNTIFIITIVMLLDSYAKNLEAVEKSPAPKKADKKQVKKSRRKGRRKVMLPDENLVAILKDSNLFEVNRGEEIVKAKAPKAHRNSNFKLVGVFHFGETKGAIITNSNRSQKASGKNHFSIGEEVGEGYKLYEVEAKSAVLKNGSRKISLELAKADSKTVRSTRNRARITTRRVARRRTSRIRR